MRSDVVRVKCHVKHLLEPYWQHFIKYNINTNKLNHFKMLMQSFSVHLPPTALHQSLDPTSSTVVLI